MILLCSTRAYGKQLMVIHSRAWNIRRIKMNPCPQYDVMNPVHSITFTSRSSEAPPIAKFMGPTWGPYGAARTQVRPMLVRWTLLSGVDYEVRQLVHDNINSAPIRNVWVHCLCDHEPWPNELRHWCKNLHMCLGLYLFILVSLYWMHSVTTTFIGMPTIAIVCRLLECMLQWYMAYPWQWHSP